MRFYNLIKDLIPRTGLIVAYGPPKEGKTFIVLDMAFHVAHGLTYRGKRTVKGSVVYITCEGQRAFEQRIVALMKRSSTNEEKGDLFVLTTSLTLPTDTRHLVWEIMAQKVAPALIVIDTLNRTLDGSESSDDDMAKYIRAVDLIRDSFNCAVLVVHHSGHSKKDRPRGHSSLIGALDALIAIKRDRKNGLITAEVQFMKDGAEGAKTFSRLQTVDLGRDDDGEPTTSCIVVPADGSELNNEAGGANTRPLTPASRIALKALQDALTSSGEAPPTDGSVTDGVARVALVGAWRKQASELGISSGEAEAHQVAFRRALNQLRDHNLVGVADPYVWLVSATNPPSEQTTEHANTP